MTSDPQPNVQQLRVTHAPVNMAGIPWENVQALRRKGVDARLVVEQHVPDIVRVGLPPSPYSMPSRIERCRAWEPIVSASAMLRLIVPSRSAFFASRARLARPKRRFTVRAEAGLIDDGTCQDTR